jgi:pantothenate kinase type III
LIERAWQQRTARLQQEVKLVLSGGEARRIAPQLSIPYRCHEYLVLDGVARIAADSVEAS